MSRTRGFPENGELVVVTVKSVEKYGVFVALDEYDRKEGFIHVREIATGWVKNISDYVREGQRTVCKVQGVDSKKGHIDLSLKSVNDHQKRERIQQWKNENKASKLFEIVASDLGKDVDKAYDSFGNMLLEDYGGLYDAFEAAVSDPEGFRADYKGAWVDAFCKVAESNIAPPSVQIEATVELTSTAPDGVVRIRNALLKGAEAAGEDDVKITSVGSPRYRFLISAADYKTAGKILDRVTNATVAAMTAAGGTAIVKRESK